MLIAVPIWRCEVEVIFPVAVLQGITSLITASAISIYNSPEMQKDPGSWSDNGTLCVVQQIARWSNYGSGRALEMFTRS